MVNLTSRLSKREVQFLQITANRLSNSDGQNPKENSHPKSPDFKTNLSPQHCKKAQHAEELEHRNEYFLAVISLPRSLDNPPNLRHHVTGPIQTYPHSSLAHRRTNDSSTHEQPIDAYTICQTKRCF